MKEEASLKITGHLVLRNKATGEILFEDKNVVMNPGKEWVARRLVNEDVVPAYFQVGLARTDPVNPDRTELEDFLDEISISSISAVGADAIYEGTWGVNDGNGELVESGIFTLDEASGGGIMIARRTFDPINKTPDIEITSTWTFTIS